MKRVALPLIPLVVGLVLTSINAEAQVPPGRKLCQLKLLQPRCSDMKKQGADLRRSPTEADGVLPNVWKLQRTWDPAIEPQRRKLSQTEPGLSARTLKIADEARDSLSAMIREAYSLPAHGNVPNGTESGALLKRLETLKVVITKTENCNDNVRPGVPNVAYIPERHTIEVCPALTHISSLQIFEAIAHELSHVISPCAMSRTLYQVSGVQPSFENICLIDGEDQERTKSILDEYAQTQSTHFTNWDTGRFEILERCGMLKVVSPGLTAVPRVFADSNECLEKFYDWQYQELMIDRASGLLGTKLSELDAGERKKLQEEKRKEPPMCFRAQEEHFADAVASRILDRKLIAMKANTKQTKESLHYLSSVACMSEIESASLTSPAYPSELLRLDIFFQSDWFQKTLGCTPGPSPLCKHPDFQPPTTSGETYKPNQANPVAR